VTSWELSLAREERDYIGSRGIFAVRRVRWDLLEYETASMPLVRDASVKIQCAQRDETRPQRDGIFPGWIRRRAAVADPVEPARRPAKSISVRLRLRRVRLRLVGVAVVEGASAAAHATVLLFRQAIIWWRSPQTGWRWNASFAWSGSAIYPKISGSEERKKKGKSTRNYAYWETTNLRAVSGATASYEAPHVVHSRLKVAPLTALRLVVSQYA
jgi:hypothetical protein